MSDPAVSLRRGNLYPSQKYKPEQSYLQNQTSYSLGADAFPYKSTAHASQRHAFQPEEALMLKPPVVDKNASDKDTIQGEQVGRYSQPHEVFRTQNSRYFHPGTSTWSNQYQRQKPCFDRLNACRTNYSLGEYQPADGLRSAAHRHFADPKSRVQPSQPVVGGWRHRDGSYRQEREAVKCVERGGGGSGGVLGVGFDIITGEADTGKRGRNRQQAGPRRSENMKEQWEAGQDRFGGHAQPHNILTGQAQPRVHAPPQYTPEQLRRPNVPVFSSRPW